MSFSVGGVGVVGRRSVWNVSSVMRALRTAALASVSCAFVRWLRNAGSAIAARIPMIRMTTRSSIRVKPRLLAHDGVEGSPCHCPLNG